MFLKVNATNSASNWSVFWDFIGETLSTVKTFLQSVTLFSIGEVYHCSLWDFCLGVIIMSAIIGQFIIFSKPVLPDQPTFNWREDRANKRYRRQRTSEKRSNYWKNKNKELY